MAAFRFWLLVLLLVAAPVAAQNATLDAPEAVSPGVPFEIAWSGPALPTDFLTVVPTDADDAAFTAYVYTAQGNPARYVAPPEPGTYEIRYLSGQPFRPLARTPLRVVRDQARLDAPDEVAAGSTFKVYWTGPNQGLDFLTIVEAGAAERAYTDVSYTEAGTPLPLTAPTQPGTYEVRYLAGQSYRTLARTMIRVSARRAELEAPASVEARSVFEIAWTGPGAAKDFLTVVPAGAPDDAAAASVLTKWGNPAKIEAPREPGAYEIRYLAGTSRAVLARQPLDVSPGRAFGAVRVVGQLDEAAEGLPEGTAVEVILDASGSMLQRHDGQRRIDLARQALRRLTTEALPPATPFALRIFGHRETGTCRTDLDLPLQPLDAATAAARLEAVEAKNLAKTPIARSLELVADDLRDVAGPRLVILVTDGEETCDGDPAEAIRALKHAYPDLRVNIVGFAIDDFGLKETFRAWAALGGGRYFDARDGVDLGLGLSEALQTPFELLDDQGRIVATGVVNGSAVEAPPGTYTVRLRTDDAREIPGVTLAAGQTADVRVN